MSDTPKFTVVDRRKFRGDEDSEATSVVETPKEEARETAPRLTLVEPSQAIQEAQEAARAKTVELPVAVADAPEELAEDAEAEDELAPMPTDVEISFQKAAYEKAAERLEDLVRAQNPAAPPTEKIGFEHLVQQLYLSAMMQMGAGTPEGQRPRIDILGARQTIDLLEVVVDKSKGNLLASEERTLATVLYELRMTFLELTRMIGQPQPPIPPLPGAIR